jgi:recombination protein RecA
MEIIQKSGAWFSYNGERLGQGRENAKQFLRENMAIAAAIDKQIRDASSLTKVIPSSGVSVDDEAEEAALFE